VSLRETINKNPLAAAGITGGLIILAIVIVVWMNSGETGPQDYFSVDDGANFVPDSAMNVPPFSIGGKTANKAYVYTCDGGKTKFVGYLERFTPDAKAKIEAVRKNPDTPVTDDPQINGAQVKLPKTGNDDKNWVKKNSPEGRAITSGVKCPGGAGRLEAVSLE